MWRIDYLYIKLGRISQCSIKKSSEEQNAPKKNRVALQKEILFIIRLDFLLKQNLILFIIRLDFLLKRNLQGFC